MGVDQVARTMARRALSAAIADVGAGHARQVVIGQGLIGAVLNALNKGVTEDEVLRALRESGGLDALRAALAASSETITAEQRELLGQLASRTADECAVCEPPPSIDPGRVVAWGPLKAEALGEVLLMAAEVADDDADHDLVTAVDVLNKDRLRPSGRPQLFEPELRQVARLLLAEVPAAERVGVPGGEVAAVNTWLAQRLRGQRLGEDAGNALAELFRSAANRLSDAPAAAAEHGGDVQ